MNKKVIEVNISDRNYPERVMLALGKSAPKTLYCQGNIDLLCSKGLGFCGSRKASNIGLSTAQDCAAQCAYNGITVVSGNAAGVDFSAHYSALENGGNTIFVLPEGINNFRIKKGMEKVWDWKRVLVLSQYAPEAPWKAFRAMERNKLIITLSHSVVVIEAGERGGTLNAGEQALKMNMPLFVAEYKDMLSHALGNKMLLDKGGVNLSKSAETNRANMLKVFEAIKKDIFINNFSEQKALF